MAIISSCTKTWEGLAMLRNRYHQMCVAIVCAALALLVAGCGCSRKGGEDAAKDSAIEAEAERFSGFENDYLRVNVAQGWDADREGDADVRRHDDKGSYRALTIEHGERTKLSDYGYVRVAVYDVETVEGAGEVPEEQKNMENIIEVDPFEVGDTRLSGYYADGKTASGDATFQYRCYAGTLNGHYVEISFVDYAGGTLVEAGDMTSMARSVEVK